MRIFCKKILFTLALGIAHSGVALAEPSPSYSLIGNIEGPMSVASYDEGFERGHYHATLDMFLHGQVFCVAGDSQAAYRALMGSAHFEKKATLQVTAEGAISYRTDLYACDESDVDGDCVKGHVVPDGILIVIPRCKSDR